MSIPLSDDGTEIIRAEQVRPACWGGGATLLLSLLSAVGIALAQGIGVIPVILYRWGELGHRWNELLREKQSSDWDPFVNQLRIDGLALSVGTYAAGIAAIFSVVFWSQLRGWLWSDYLAIRGFSWRAGWMGFTGLALFLAVTHSSGEVAEEGGADFMIRAYQTAVFLPLLTTALIVIAPIWEELFFRGFMHRGLAAAWGPVPAILFCSACWAVMHVQYDMPIIILLFLIGVFFGFVRQWSGSTVLVILLHAAMNAVAVIETIYYVGHVVD